LTFNRLSIIPAPARKHARAITLCSAAIAGVAMPTLASAATVGSTHAAPVAAVSSASSASTGVVRDVSTTTSTSASAPAASSSASTSTYTVVAGDTLYGIAQRTLGNGNDYHKLFDLNKDRSEGNGATFTDPNLIDVGWTLLVPTSGGSTASTAPASTAPATTTTTTDSSSSSTSQSAPSTTSSDSNSSSSSAASSNTASSDSTSSSTTGTDSSTGTQQSTSTTSYADNLDGWINQAISVLSANGYSVSYNAVYQTAMNESSGNPAAVNGWDSNAAGGTPSIGLMQMIQPTFDAYALPGYTDISNPVDNIIASAIYAQNTYGGLDNVVSARCDGSCWYGY
jgi:hypothetical protein